MKDYTVAQVAEKLGVVPYTVRRWLKSGRLKGTKPGGQWRVSSKTLTDFQRTTPHAT